MGMDLIGAGLSYNWGAWKWLKSRLAKWGVNVDELQDFNDGAPISKETCSAIAAALEAHLDEFSPDEREWIEVDIEGWRNCRGCEQW
jgi:hypothetical protein